MMAARSVPAMSLGLRCAQDQVGLLLRQHTCIYGRLRGLFQRKVLAALREFLERPTRCHQIGLLLRDGTVGHSLGEAGLTCSLLRCIEFVDGLPKTVSGKIRRVELRAREEGRA